MFNTFKKDLCKISAASIGILMITGFAVITSVWSPCANASTSTAVSPAPAKPPVPSIVNQKIFYRLDMVPEFQHFRFKAPTFIPKGYSFSKMTVFGNDFEKNSDIEAAAIDYYSQDTGKAFSLEILSLKPAFKNLKNSNMETIVKTASRQIGTIKGIDTTSTLKAHDEAMKFTSSSINKSFYWQDGDLWYAINYYSSRTINGKVSTPNVISSAVLEKIVSSLKSPNTLKQNK